MRKVVHYGLGVVYSKICNLWILANNVVVGVVVDICVVDVVLGVFQFDLSLVVPLEPCFELLGNGWTPVSTWSESFFHFLPIETLF